MIINFLEHRKLYGGIKQIAGVGLEQCSKNQESSQEVKKGIALIVFRGIENIE